MIKSTCGQCWQEYTHNGTEVLCATCEVLSPLEEAHSAQITAIQEEIQTEIWKALDSFVIVQESDCSEEIKTDWQNSLEELQGDCINAVTDNFADYTS